MIQMSRDFNALKLVIFSLSACFNDNNFNANSDNSLIGSYDF